MSDARDEMRVYGTADESNSQSMPAQGYRGERAATAPKPAQRRRAKGIAVEEESGTAYAERSIGATPVDQVHVARPARSRSGLLAVGALVAAGAAAGVWLARRMKSEAYQAEHHAAFRHRQTTPENFDQTRDSGPEHIRNESVGRRWDQVDETVDESFPASDPPGTY